MADASDVLTAFREELIAAGVGRRPSEPGPMVGEPYPVVIEDAEGAPAPGELADEEYDHGELVLTLTHDGDVAGETNYTARTGIVRVVNVAYRALGNEALRKAMALDAAIVTRLIRPETNYGYGFMLGTDAALYVNAATVFAGFGPVSRARGRAFHHAAKYAIEVRLA